MSNKCGTEYPIVGENPFLKYLINGDGFYCEKVVTYYGHDFQGSVILLFTKVSEAIRNGSRRIGPRGPTVRGPTIRTQKADSWAPDSWAPVISRLSVCYQCVISELPVCCKLVKRVISVLPWSYQWVISGL